MVQGKRQMGRSGWSRQQHSVQSHNSQSSSSSGVFSSRSNGGSGGDVRGRWRREINVSNHLEVELKGSSIPNSRILQTTAANLKFHPVLNLKSTSETRDFPSEVKFRFPWNTNSDDDCEMMFRNGGAPLSGRLNNAWRGKLILQVMEPVYTLQSTFYKYSTVYK